MVACDSGCKIAQFYHACNGKCLSTSEPCNGACPDGQPACGPRCLIAATRSLFHACGAAECLSRGVPCNGTCPADTTKCGPDRCLSEEGGGEKKVYYECQGACVTALTACDGKCPEGAKKCPSGCCSDEFRQILYSLEHPVQGNEGIQ